MTPEHPNDPIKLPSKGLVPIRTVANLTGVNPVTLRAWERRYGLIKPIRTPKGHRLYTMADVDLIHQVTALLEAGMSIGQVRQVLISAPPKSADAEDQAESIWANYQRKMIEAITRFEESRLDEVYNEALSLYPVDIVTSRLIVPLLRELGWRWERTEGGIAEEHFFAVYLRNKLGARFHHLRRKATGPRLLAACLPNEHHEVGILLFALAALDRNYQIVLLGANMPLLELCTVVQRAHCQALVLSGSSPDCASKSMQKELVGVVKKSVVPVFMGGKIVTDCPEQLMATGVILLGEDFNSAFRKIDVSLNRH